MGAVFLDLDGTLTDSAPPIMAAVAHALRESGMPVPGESDLRDMVGPPLIDTFTALGAADPEVTLGHYRSHYTGDAMLNVAVYDGIMPALDRLRAQERRLYLMTAKPHEYARRITAHLGLAGYMTQEYGPEMDGRFNDKAQLLIHALRETGERPEASVMVGDRTNDLRAGRAAGMPVIAALWGYGCRAELAGADLLLDTPAELPAAVARLI